VSDAVRGFAMRENTATSENSINLLREAYDEYQHIAPIREVITDHGSQFYANKRDLQGNAEHSFELFCKEMGFSTFWHV